MAKRTYTEQQRNEALKLYETEGPSAASKTLEIPKSTIRNWARAEGVSTVPAQKTHAATQARATDLKARRTEISADLLDRYTFVMEKLTEQTQTVSAGSVVTTEQPTPEALQRLVTTAGILLDKHLALIKHDADNGAAEARSMLDALRTQLGMGGE